MGFVPWSKDMWNFFMVDLNEILLNIMLNSWSKQSYVQVFDCEIINFKAAVNMFERMEI